MIELIAIILLSPCFTMFVHWCLGSPNAGNTNVVQGRIFSPIGNRLMNRYIHAKSRAEDDAVVFWKAFICPICLNFWTTTFIYLIYAITGFGNIVFFLVVGGSFYLISQLNR